MGIGVANAVATPGKVWLVLAIVGMVLGAGALGTAIYSIAETYPNYKRARRRYVIGSALRSLRSRRYNRYSSGFSSLIYRSNENALKTQIVLGMWGCGLLALVFGLLAVIKKRKIGFIPLGLGLVPLIISIFVQPAHW